MRIRADTLPIFIYLLCSKETLKIQNTQKLEIVILQVQHPFINIQAACILSLLKECLY
jgi:hypothetical protein